MFGTNKKEIEAKKQEQEAAMKETEVHEAIKTPNPPVELPDTEATAEASLQRYVDGQVEAHKAHQLLTMDILSGLSSLSEAIDLLDARLAAVELAINKGEK